MTRAAPKKNPTRKKTHRKRGGARARGASGLSLQRQRFVEEYLIDGIGTQAAIRAGYSERSAGQQADRLLKNDEIAAAIEAGRKSLSETAKTTAEWARKKLRMFAESDILQFASWDSSTVTLKSSELLPAGLSQCIQEITQTKDGVRIKLVDKRAAIADLRALDGLDEPTKSELTGKDGAPLGGVMVAPGARTVEEWLAESKQVHQR